jgi:hypothetical protein
VKREEAIAVLKEIVETCNKVDYKHIALNAIEESEGYELHIKNHFDEADFERLKDVLQKRNLSMKKHKDYVVIYKPKPI